MISFPKSCKHCTIDPSKKEHWYQDGKRWRCCQQRRDYRRRRYAEGKLKVSRKRTEEGERKVKIRRRYYAAKTNDKKKGFTGTLNTIEAYLLMDGKPCHYCEVMLPVMGLDRKDSSMGHRLDNVVTCCEECNMLLTDLPYEAKKILAPGLKQLRDEGHLDRWIIPQKRNRNKK